MISHTGQSKETIHIAETVRKTGAKTIVITSQANSSLAKLGDVVFISISEETEFRSEALASRISQLSILDSLYVILMFYNEKNHVVLSLKFDILFLKSKNSTITEKAKIHKTKSHYQIFGSGFLVLQGWYRTSIVGGLERMSSHLWRRLYWYYSSYLLDAITKLVYSSKNLSFLFFIIFVSYFLKIKKNFGELSISLITLAFGLILGYHL